MLVLIDCETFSTQNLKQTGQHKYAQDCEPILWSIRAMDWSESLVFEGDLYQILKDLKKAGQLKYREDAKPRLVHWGSFDRVVQAGQGTRFEQDEESWIDEHGFRWIDARVISLTYGAPGKLDLAAHFWGKGVLKLEGAELINRFCLPYRGKRMREADDPIRWEKFRAYARRDTAAMVGIIKNMQRFEGHTVEDHWRYQSAIDRMNERGVPIDVDSAVRCQSWLEGMAEEIKATFKDAYGFVPTQVAALKEYLGVEDCRAETLETLLASPHCTEDQRELILARQAVSGAAVKKLLPMIRMAEEDGRVRGCFDYHGAHTRRMTSFGVQFQNMLRSESDEAFFSSIQGSGFDPSAFEAVRRNMRGFIKAPEGRVLVAADYSQIELRYGAWIAGEEWMLEAFRSGDDLYRIAAGSHMRKAPEDVTSDERQFGKTVELASIFGISAIGKDGAGGLKAYAEGMGVDMNDDAAWAAWRTYRMTHPAIVRAWGAFESAVQAVINRRDIAVSVLGHTVEGDEAWVRVVRPSGFADYLWFPTLEARKGPDGQQLTDDYGNPLWSIRYLARDRSGAMSWRRTWGSDIYQTATQGGAADLMLEGLVRAEDAGFPPIMAVHDEIVTEVDDPGEEYHDALLAELNATICSLPDWAKGLPVSSEGWVGKRFTK